MNKRIRAALCLALLLCLPQTAAATETGCRITGEAVVTLPGRTVEIPIEISGNPGFTNFGIELAYDREKLRLEEILVPRQEGDCLVDALSGINPARPSRDGNTQTEKTHGYVAAAAREQITGNGKLFVARFAVLEGAEGTTQVTPVVHYLHSCGEKGEFSDVPVTGEALEVRILSMGDIIPDGIIEYDDVMAACAAAAGETQLPQTEKAVADMDGNGEINLADAEAIYKLYIGGE